MEVQINNSYLQNFISKYSNQSATKVMKYLAVLGLHFLEKNSKEDISLNELKAFAKSVMKPQVKESRQNEADLRMIKEELLKLSKRVEGKLANSAPQQQEESEKPKGSRKNGKESPSALLSRTASSSKKIDTPTFSQKPPSARKDIEKRGSELRVSQLESIQEREDRMSREQNKGRLSPAHRYIEWQEGSVGPTKDEYGLTPKPNEILFTGIEPKGSSKNIVTRHHLDGSQAKELMKEEGIVFFPQRLKNETPKQQKIPNPGSSSKKDAKLASYSFTDRKPQELKEDIIPAWSYEVRSPQSQISQSKPPQSAQSRDYFSVEKQSHAFDIKKEDLVRTNTPKSSSRVPRERSGQRVQQREDSGIRNSQSSKTLKPEKKSGIGSLNSSKTKSSHTRNKSNFKNVDSKIKDEINYHKELSKQYRKMKQNMGNFDDLQDELLGSSTRRAFSKEPSKYPEEYTDLNPFEESSRYNRQNPYGASSSRGFENSNSALKSSLTTQQLSGNFAEKTPAQQPSRANKFEGGAWRNEDVKEYNYTEESKGGMLDIANNFLNSPLMQHLSNIDIRNLDTSMKDSIFNTNLKPQKNTDSLMFTGGIDYKGTTTTYEGEDEARLRQSGNGLGQSRNSKWDNADYQLEKNKVNASILKDSTNRRFRDNMSKEISGNPNNNNNNVYDKEGPNSLASSNFSNFLSDEMKGFYQKEPFDTKKPKNNEVKFGNSENSSNMSFSMNGAATTREKSAEQNYFRRSGFKNEAENKSGETFSFDNANVFKNERMSITHLMSN